MDLRIALVTFVIGLVAAKYEVREFHQEPGLTRHKFCNKLDCPEYTSKNFGAFEERKYVDTQWVSTTLAGFDYRDASGQMFERLFAYIRGANKQKKTIAMTAPVKMSVTHGQGPACDNNFTMSFFISTKMKNPPKPTAEDVFLDSVKSQRFYVRSFPGYARTAKEWLDQAEKLGSDLMKAGKTNFDHHLFYTAGYNSPFQWFDRHNEIWFPVTHGQ